MSVIDEPLSPVPAVDVANVEALQAKVKKLGDICTEQVDIIEGLDDEIRTLRARVKHLLSRSRKNKNKKLRVSINEWDVSDWGNQLLEGASFRMENTGYGRLEIACEIGDVFNDIATVIATEALDSFFHDKWNKLVEIGPNGLRFCTDDLNYGEPVVVPWKEISIVGGKDEVRAGFLQWIETQDEDKEDW